MHFSFQISNETPSVDHADENLNPNEAYDTSNSVDSDFDEYIDSEEDGHTEAKGHYDECKTGVYCVCCVARDSWPVYIEYKIIPAT